VLAGRWLVQGPWTSQQRFSGPHQRQFAVEQQGLADDHVLVGPGPLSEVAEGEHGVREVAADPVGRGGCGTVPVTTTAASSSSKVIGTFT
jgi:hypothetical protein